MNNSWYHYGPEIQTLNDIFPEWIRGNGIFHYMAIAHTNLPWADREIEYELDMDYHGNHSGDKLVSPLIRKYIEHNDYSPQVDLPIFADIVYNINIDNWRKIWDLEQAEYNPIENYNMLERGTTGEERTETSSNSSTNANTRTHNERISDTSTETRTETPTKTVSGNTGYHGFNSVLAQPVGESQTIETGNNSVSGSNTHTNEHTGTISDSASTSNSGNISTDTSGNHTLTRTGNIGVMTTQQMAEQERKLRTWNFFRDFVYPSIDKILCSRDYSVRGV